MSAGCLSLYDTVLVTLDDGAGGKEYIGAVVALERPPGQVRVNVALGISPQEFTVPYSCVRRAIPEPQGTLSAPG